MKKTLLLFAYFISVGTLLAQKSAYIPQTGSEERTAIMDVMRLDFYPDPAAAHNNSKRILFKVYSLKVHNGWAFTRVVPLNAEGKEFAEPRCAILKHGEGSWRRFEHAKLLPAPKDDPEADDIQDLESTVVAKVLQKMPEIPSDIFDRTPKATRIEDNKLGEQDVAFRRVLSPILAKPRVFSKPNKQSPHPDSNDGVIEDRCAFDAKRKITNSQGVFLFGNIRTPRGVDIVIDAYVIASEWR